MFKILRFNDVINDKCVWFSYYGRCKASCPFYGFNDRSCTWNLVLLNHCVSIWVCTKKFDSILKVETYKCLLHQRHIHIPSNNNCLDSQIQMLNQLYWLFNFWQFCNMDNFKTIILKLFRHINCSESHNFFDLRMLVFEIKC